MGLASGFVFAADRQGILAVVSIAASVAYALVAGAAVTGLKDAQSALAEGVQDTRFVVFREDYAPFYANVFGPAPASVLHRIETEGRVVVWHEALRWRPPADDELRAGPSAAKTSGVLELAGRRFNVTTGLLAPGAMSDWYEGNRTTFRALGGSTETASLAVFESLTPGEADRIRGSGFVVVETPGALPFYVGGANQLATTVYATVAASTLVVGLLASAFVQLELQAKRRSFATVQVFAGPRFLTRMVLARGAVLLAAGHLLALAATEAVLVLLRRADVAPLHLPFSYLAITFACTLAGGAAGVLPAVRSGTRKLQALDLVSPAPRFGLRALRPTLVAWRSLLPLTIAAIVLSASLGVVFGAVRMPSQIFGQEEDGVVASTTGNPLRGSFPEFLGVHLHETDEFSASSPEIFAPTTLRGHPVMVRGVSWEHLARLDPLRVAHGTPPDAVGEIALGERLASRLSARVGDAFWVPAAYPSSAHRLEVTAIVEIEGILADEALATLETARLLTGLPRDLVNLIRTRAESPADADGGFPPLPTGIEVTSVRVEPPDAVPFEAAEAIATVINFAPHNASRTITLRVSGAPVAATYVALPAYGSGEARIPFTMPLNRTARLQVNPSVDHPAGPPAYALEFISPWVRGRELVVRVTDASGSPAADATVRLDGAAVTVDGSGRARIVPPEAGNRTILVAGPDGRAARQVFIVAEEDADRGRIVARQLTGPLRQASTQWTATATVENVGGRTSNGTLSVIVDGESKAEIPVGLAPGVRGLVTIDLTLAIGAHTVEVGGRNVTVVIDPTIASDDPEDPGAPRTVQQLLDERRMRARVASPGATDPTSAFLGDTFENFEAAVTVVVIACFIHAGLVVAVTVFREASGHAATIGVFSSIGAGRRAMRRRALLEYGFLAAIAGTVGTAVGLGLAWIAGLMGTLLGFGHALLPEGGLRFPVQVFLVFWATVAGAAVVAVEGLRGRNVRALMAEGPTRGRRPPLERLL